jgi:pyruvate dehydrogenase E2 component (dihydrolipoamide acetyltransferase)
MILSDINIAMAVALDGGLITPTLKNADKVDIYSLGRKWKELVKKAQEKRLAADEYSTGTRQFLEGGDEWEEGGEGASVWLVCLLADARACVVCRGCAGTFTISNLGMFQVSAFDAILPPGQGSILAIGSSVPTVVVQVRHKEHARTSNFDHEAVICRANYCQS